ncbi:MAG: phosphoenolpyruvate--protein phosphotransferase [Rhizobiaceae bacterium]
MERTFPAISASPGIWTGTVHRQSDLSGLSRISGNPAREAEALASAISAALESLAALAATQAGEAADMLAFQAAMLEDPELAELAFQKIDNGMAAEAAWQECMAAEIDGYELSGDEYFRARSADLADIRDRVLAGIFGVPANTAIAVGAVIVAQDLKPSVFLDADWDKGGAIILGKGSAASHVAMLARARGVPMVVGLGEEWQRLEGAVMVDAMAGSVTVNPDAATIMSASHRASIETARKQAAATRIADPAVTRDGTCIKVMINVATLADLKGLNASQIDGIGLTRTEFLVEKALRDEDKQFADYSSLLKWAGAKPVTIRTFDAGGDKPVPGYTLAGESNPLLGLRGIRLSLQHKDVFKVQLRAILRAAVHGNAKIMLPMVTDTNDLESARELINQCSGELNAAGVAHSIPELGIMVEVPAVAMAPELFDAEFFSIGSNDLTQYATAAGRDSAEAARWADVTHPGVLAMIANVARHGIATGKEVSLCGDAGGEPASIGSLLKEGVRCVSVAPGLLALAKAAIRATDLSGNGVAA